MRCCLTNKYILPCKKSDHPPMADNASIIVINTFYVFLNFSLSLTIRGFSRRDGSLSNCEVHISLERGCSISFLLSALYSSGDIAFSLFCGFV